VQRVFLRQISQLSFLSLVILIAILLPAAAQDTPEKTNPHERWESTIAKFEEQDKANPPAKGGVLFVGSSSIRLWRLDESFPDLGAINRGFGGSEIADSTHFAKRIILKHEPRQIFLYAGDNDIARGKSAETVTDDFRKFVNVVRQDLPQTRLVFIAIKPSIKRWALADENAKANAAILKICQQDDLLGYADIWKPMLGQDGKPRPELFAKDGLHLNGKGYELWTAIVKPLIKPARK
jgi:lysophospholipase L1-like esterase